MAHAILFELISDLARAVDLPEPIVEFGSMQVEEDQPNDLRPLFHQRDFIGTDMREGPGVDRVEDLRSLSFDDGEIGTAICLDTLEHCVDPLAACRELHRVVADGGVCVISSVMLIGVHAHPSDYWRFTPEGFRALLREFEFVDVASWGDPEIPYFVFGVGTKGPPLDVRLAELPGLSRAQADWERALANFRIGPFRYTPRQLARVVGGELPRVLRELARVKLGRTR